MNVVCWMFDIRLTTKKIVTKGTKYIQMRSLANCRNKKINNTNTGWQFWILHVQRSHVECRPISGWTRMGIGSVYESRLFFLQRRSSYFSLAHIAITPKTSLHPASPLLLWEISIPFLLHLTVKLISFSLLQYKKHATFNHILNVACRQ